MLKFAYKKFWVPVMGRILAKVIPIIEGKKPDNLPTYDIDAERKDIKK
tara:strand:+ start:1912 stop:2055 length:144 start_codon:yes stop_codon:yes gene_type:complete